MTPLLEVSADGEIVIDGDEEVEPLKMAKDPRLPSAEDVEIHDRTHLPYRDWCKWCNMGRARDASYTFSRLGGAHRGR